MQLGMRLWRNISLGDVPPGRDFTYQERRYGSRFLREQSRPGVGIMRREALTRAQAAGRRPLLCRGRNIQTSDVVISDGLTKLSVAQPWRWFSF
jgi:hypothetical protein